MSDWNSKQYLKFINERTQPAIDLAVRIKNDPQTIVDIGCGPGNSTKVLRDTFPNAEIWGIDSSPNMIERAKAENPDISFCLCDALSLEGKYDLLFSNACLQWIPNHSTLIPSLMEKLNDGGVLAVQVPINGDEPLFRLISEVAGEAKWGLSGIMLQPNETLTPPEYYNILSGCSSVFNMWEVKYHHTLPDHKALVEWVKGTRLRPYLDYLGAEKGAEFESEIIERSKKLYPIMSDGNVVLGFRRFFFTAQAAK